MIQETRILMGMPVTIAIADRNGTKEALEKIFRYFHTVDERFSPFKESSEVGILNRDQSVPENLSDDMRSIMALGERTKQETNGYFDVMTPEGVFDPSGIVKGWAIFRAAEILRRDGYRNFFVDAGGDIQPRGMNAEGKKWRIGIRNPFKTDEIVKAIFITNEGVATSGTYLRGKHIYDPLTRKPANDILSLTIVGPNVLEADRFATGVFAMGKNGISFIEKLNGFEGYVIDNDGIATMTSGFSKYTEE